MKIKAIATQIIVLFLFMSCGEPNDPLSLKQNESVAGHTIMSRIETTGYAQDVIVKDNIAFIAQGEGGLFIADVSDPSNPKEITTLTDRVRGYSIKIAMKDSIVYVAAGNFGLTIINVANPYFPFVLKWNQPPKPAKNFHIMGDYLFTSISETGIKISDISIPESPDHKHPIKPAGYVRSVATTADGKYLFAACGEIGLSIIDISDFQDGFGYYPEIANSNTPGYSEEIIIDDERKVAYMACGTSGLQIIDFSDMTNVNIIGSYDGNGYAKDMKYKNEKIYLTINRGGLEIIDVSDLSKPYLLGNLYTEYSLGIDIDDKYIYIADEKEGLIIISYPTE